MRVDVLAALAALVYKCRHVGLAVSTALVSAALAASAQVMSLLARIWSLLQKLCIESRSLAALAAPACRGFTLKAHLPLAATAASVA